MQALIPILGKIGTVVAGLTGTAGASGVALASASAGLGTITSVLGLAGGLQQLSYQKRVAAQYATQMEENNQRRTYAAAREAQDQDAQAAAALGDLTARQAETGFSTLSPSFQRVLSRNRLQAQTNRERIIEGAATDVQNNRNRAQSVINETKGKGFPTLLEGLGGIAESAIGGATLIRKAKVNSIQRSYA